MKKNYYNDLDNFDLLNELKNEQVLLLEKVRKAREEDNIGTYKNLILALKEVTYLIQNEKVKLKSEKMYIDIGEITYIYYKGKMLTLKGTKNVEAIANKVIEAVWSSKDVPIYIDTRAYGLALYQFLESKGYNVLKTENLNIKIN